MVTPRARALLPTIFWLFGCSSSGFEVGQGDASDDTAASTDVLADTASKVDSTAIDSAIPPDIGATDTSVATDTRVDVGCALGTTKACECNGVRTCGADGTYGPCHDVCLPSPARFLCAFGKGTCTAETCFDSNNCPAKCGCAAAPGSKCALTDPCWGYVCNDFVCPG